MNEKTLLKLILNVNIEELERFNSDIYAKIDELSEIKRCREQIIKALQAAKFEEKVQELISETEKNNQEIANLNELRTRTINALKILRNEKEN